MKKKYVCVILETIFGIISLLCIIGIIFYKPSYEKIKESVVKIEVYDDSGLLGTGSGFSAFEPNFIVTNYHVIEGAKEIKIITDDNEEYYINNIIIFDKDNDLAILEIPIDLTPLTISGKELKTGDEVSAIGSPKGELNTVSEGIISNTQNDKGIQISAPISHGSSGGVLLDNKRKVIGITYAGYDDAQNLNYAISVDYLNDLYQSYNNGFYYEITEENIETCYDEFRGMHEIQILGGQSPEFNGCDGGDYFYSVNSLNNFYKITNSSIIYDQMNRNNLEYNKLSQNEKVFAFEYYISISDSYGWYIELSEVDLNSISKDSFVMLFGKKILKNDLAITVAHLNSLSDKDDKFQYINSLGFEKIDKIILSYFYAGFDLTDFHNTNVEDLADYIFENYRSDITLRNNIFEIFGYEVKNDTVYW